MNGPMQPSSAVVTVEHKILLPTNRPQTDTMTNSYACGNSLPATVAISINEPT